MRHWISPLLVSLNLMGGEYLYDPVDCAFSTPHDLDLNCPRNFFFHIDGLAFQAKQDGMEYAIRSSESQGPIVGGKVIDFSDGHKDWKFQPGVRLGIGYFFEHDHWDLNFDWTWLNITEYKQPHVPNGTVLIPLWLTGDSSGVGLDSTTSAAKWEAEYNALDILFGKPIDVSNLYVLKPHFGIRTAWIDQHFSVRYNGTFENVSPVIHHALNDFWGVGARIGANNEFYVGKAGLLFFGNFAASIVFGKFNVSQDLPFTGAIDGFDFTYATFQNIPNIECAIGFGWETFLMNRRYHLCFRASYEFQQWFDQLRLRRFYSGAGGIVGDGKYPNSELSRNNFTLNGFSLRFQFDL